MEGREEKLAALETEVERDLTLIGCTAIEDKLQEGVPASILTLLAAGIKVGLGEKQCGVWPQVLRGPVLLLCTAAGRAREMSVSACGEFDTGVTRESARKIASSLW